MLDTVKEFVALAHSKQTCAQRWGRVQKGQNVPMTGTCANGFQSTYKGVLVYPGNKFNKPPALEAAEFCYIVNPGDGADFPLQALSDKTIRQEVMKGYTRGIYEFEGTFRSRKWVDFLLSEQSPYRALFPFLKSDADFTNKYGAIFEKPAEVPAKLLYNFYFALRYPWEVADGYSMFLHLVEAGIPQPEAAFISMNFQLREGASGIDGPYQIVYPWSFLEGTNLSAAYRFCHGRPGTLKADEPCSPNVFPLWQVDSLRDKWQGWCSQNAKSLLSLSEIMKALDEAEKDGEAVCAA